ncbi:tRNA 2-thiouridine(34) synthase MnmA [Candidatus Nomurabacteria bacterium]|nr:tRNA 2-thiouridine(34) synthase MnmA [Candidatus Nomurabacteria bacterium]
MNPHSPQKVYVGLSGGVDSSVSAALLKEEGYEVTGVFIKAWYPDFLNCNWKEEKRDVMRVCAHLDIPFKLLDLSKEYKEGVIDYLVEEYQKGRTPNPDVMCNKEIKFGGFFDWAIKEGADYVATGHYAQTKQIDSGEYRLFKSKDQNKDQTYFLWTLQQKHLEKTLFPIGHLEKQEVRKLAKKYDLFTSVKKDSQGLCFLGALDMKQFLKKYIDAKEGNVLNESGEIIGKHQGAELYTLGERHGFEIFKKNPATKPLFLINKDLLKNTITVSEEKPVTHSLNNSLIKLSNLNLNSKISQNEVEVEVRFRYRQELKKAILNIQNNTLSNIEDTEIATTGQSAVFYQKSQCLGGGVIES